MFLAFKCHGAVLGIFNGKMAFKCYTEFSNMSHDSMAVSTLVLLSLVESNEVWGAPFLEVWRVQE